MAKEHAICVYCGAQNAVSPHYLKAGTAFGKLLAEQNITLVYGGGDCGMMGATANSVLENGGKVVGVFPRELQELEPEHRGLTEIHIVDGMHERKKLMFDRSDGFVALPGGFGTLDETFEMITWRQLDFHRKPIIIFNYEGYWEHWIKLAEHIINEKFAIPETRDCFTVVNEMDQIIPTIMNNVSQQDTSKEPPF